MNSKDFSWIQNVLVEFKLFYLNSKCLNWIQKFKSWQIVIKNNQNVISMSNFDFIKTKSRKNKKIKHIFNLSFNVKSIMIYFCYVDVFIEKYNAKSNIFFLFNFLKNLQLRTLIFSIIKKKLQVSRTKNIESSQIFISRWVRQI